MEYMKAMLRYIYRFLDFMRENWVQIFVGIIHESVYLYSRTSAFPIP